MEDNNIGGGMFLGAFLLLIAIGLFAVGGKAGENRGNEKFYNCVTLMNRVTPDPNDTQARSSFLKECYEAKTNE